MIMRVIAIVLLAAFPVVIGCSGPEPPPPPDPTIVDLSLIAAPNANPNREGDPSPVVVSVYTLTTTGPFDEADFFRLVDDWQATLGATVVDRNEFTIPPGQQKGWIQEVAADARFVAVQVSYRQIERAIWRGTAPIQAEKTNKIRAQIGQFGVVVEAEIVTAEETP